MTIPDWVDRSAYPFRPRWLELDAGRMHYIDEGSGPPVVFVHGTPVWSFLYRDLIKPLAAGYRCIAMDHLGFGLSDKPRGWGYRPADHARNLAALIDQLGLRDLTLVVHDFGGPIGLSYAVSRPDNVARLVLFNTWMWSLSDNREAALISRIMGGRLGKLLYTQLNFSPRVLLPQLMGDRRKLTPQIHRHYLAAAPTPANRESMWVLARELAGSSEWYDQLWQQRERIRRHPALLLWGLRDRGVQAGIFDLARWQALFSDARTITFPKAGHFVQEEAAAESAQAIAAFLSQPAQVAA